MKEKLLAAGERAVKTFAQVLAAFIVASEVTSIEALDFRAAVGVALLATLLSVLTSVASMSFGNPGPSLTTEELVPEGDPADEELGRG